MPAVSDIAARYPFSSTAEETFNEYGRDAMVNKRARQRALQRIRNAIETDGVGTTATDGNGQTDNEVELLSYPIARILISLVNEHRVTAAYAKAEANTAIQRIRRNDDLDFACDEFDIDPQDVSIETVAEETALATRWEQLEPSDRHELMDEAVSNLDSAHGLFDDDVPFEQFVIDLTSHGVPKYSADWTTDELYTVGLDTYLTYVPDRGAREWRLSNRTLLDGRVLLNKAELHDLLREGIRQRVKRDLPMENIPSVISDQLQDELDTIRRNIPEDFISIDIDRVEEELFPPVIKHLISAIQEGKNLKHMERFTAASFLINIGMEDDEIVRLFGIGENTPNFVEDQTRYQLEHIRRNGDDEAYTPPTYDTIDSWGTTWQKDALEESVNHPLTYYRIKLEEQEEEEE